MVFDPEPKSSAPPVSVRIPGEDDTPFAPKMPAKPKAKAPEPKKSEAPKAEAAKPEPVKPVEKKAAPKAPEKESPKIAGNKAPTKVASAAERQRAEAALAGGEQYYVQVGAFSDPESAVAKLKAAKIPYYTDDLAVKGGKVTRVRAGPYSSKAAAEKTAERLKGLGFKPG